jgi:uncharacterized protein
MLELSIKIREIPEHGADLDVALSRPFLKDALEGMDADLTHSHVNARVHVMRTGDNVFVSGQLQGEVELSCVRCLRQARVGIEVPLKLTATPHLDGESVADDEVEDDVDYFTHDGETVELGGVLREALILGLPMTALCRPDCRGLCPVCGGDRNQSACGCEPPGLEDPRFAALKGLKV